MWREFYILSAENLFLSTQCHCHSVLRHTSSHYIIIIFIIDFISLLFLTLRKSKLNYASFLTRSLGFLELFSNSPWSVFLPPLMSLSFHDWLSWEPSDLSALDPNSPPWLAVKSPWVSLYDGWHMFFNAFWLISVFFSLFNQILSSNICFS